MDIDSFKNALRTLSQDAVKNAKKCVIFKASSAYNCHHISDLISFLDKISPQDLKITNPDAFNHVLTTIQNYVNSLENFNSENWFNSIMKWNEQQIESVPKIFHQTFKNTVQELGINPDDAIPIKEEQYEINNKSDFKKIRQYLKDWLSNKENENSSKAEEVKGKIEILIEIEGKKELFKEQMKDFSNLNINDTDLMYDTKASDTHLGDGGFGRVMKATRYSTSEFVAVKEIRTDKLSPHSWSSLFAEIFSMSSVHHPYILELVGAHIHPPYQIITRYCSGRSLFDRLHRRLPDFPSLTPTDLTKIAYQIASGMEYLHKNRIIHRDLKTLNILLDGNGNACIADFGLSSTFKDDNSMNETVGTPHYTAPEVLIHTHYGPKVDVYSYAIVLWEMLTKEVPFSDMLPYDIYDHVVTNGWRLAIPQDASPELAKLITECWSKNPNDRPDFSDIVSLFEEGKILFPNSAIEKGYYQQLKKEVHCPPINVDYAIHVLKSADDPHFGTVTKFISEKTDKKLTELLRNEKVLDEIVQYKQEYYDSILLLASKLLDTNNVDEYQAFLEKHGKSMFDHTIKQGTLNGALNFVIMIPDKLIGEFKQFIPQIVSYLDKINPMDENNNSISLVLRIFNFLSKFDDEDILIFKDQVCKCLPMAAKEVSNQKSPLFTKDNFNAVVRLFQIYSDEYQFDDILVFYPLISECFEVTPDFAESLKNKSDPKDYPLFVLYILKALKKNSLHDFLIVFIQEVANKKDSQLFQELSKMDDCFTTLQELLENNKTNIYDRDRDTLVAPLLVFFCIAQIKEAAIKIARHPLLTALLDIQTHHEQRLQILTALTLFEEFCEERINKADNTDKMDKIIHLLASDLMDDKYRDYAIRLISAMSTHKTGCMIMHDNSVFVPFVQLFLNSPLGDSSAAYTILRNAAKFRITIPQSPLIVSCLMQNTMFEMARKDEILDTLIALVSGMQGSIQDTDLRTIILPQLSRETPRIVYRSLKLFSVCDATSSLTDNTVEDLLSAINEILNDPQKMYPCIIEAAVEVLINIAKKQKGCEPFYVGTGLIEFLEKAIQLFPPGNEKRIETIQNFIFNYNEQKRNPFLENHNNIKNSNNTNL